MLQSQKQAASHITQNGLTDTYSELSEVLSNFNNVLLSGPPGCGKSSIVTKVLSDLEIPYHLVECSSLASPDPGQSETMLREHWSSLVSCGGGALLLDNVECITGRKRTGNRVMSQLLSLLDSSRNDKTICVVGVTTEPNNMDPVCRRHGRFEFESNIKSLAFEQRLEIVKSLVDLNSYDIGEKICQHIATNTAGWLIADLSLIVRKLSLIPNCAMTNVETELINCRPAQLKSGIGNVNISKVSWDSLGGLQDVKAKLVRAVQLPLSNPDSFTKFGIQPCKGVLLSGPPGCGKTSLVRATASQCNVNFLSVSLAEIFSPYVGDSEKALVEVFSKARKLAPSILFLDEIETFVASRGEYDSGQSSSDRVLSALLQEMDGLGGELGGRVIVVGATNRPQALDSALTRPGRFDVHIAVPLPNSDERQDILKTVMNKVPQDNIDLAAISDMTEDFTGADLECLVREAVLLALSEDINCDKLSQKYLEQILSRRRTIVR